MKPYSYMSDDEICNYIALTDTNGCMNQLLFLILFISFLIIIVRSKKYRPIWDEFVGKYLKWM